MKKEKLLLHVCCAPCSTVPIERLNDEFDITCFFYNPNIQPEQEYERRLAELKRFADQIKIPLLIGDYDVNVWNELVTGFEQEPERGNRCKICFTRRLAKTAALAKENGFCCFATTLTLSPHKDSPVINEIGLAQCQATGIIFLEENFKKRDGYRRSLELSAYYHFYRQYYCGCRFSRKP